MGEVSLALPTYGVLFAAAALGGWIWFQRRARGLGVDPDAAFNLSFYTVLLGLLGAKLMLVVVEWRLYWENPRLLLGTLRSAGVLMGGIVAGALTFLVYCRRHGLPTLALADAVAAPLTLGQAVGRLGCFFAGCCYGVRSHGRLAVIFSDPRAAAQTGIPLHVPLVPVQLYEMAGDLLLAGLLAWLWHRRLRPEGTVFWIYLLLYSTMRALLEFWRGDAQRGLYFGGRVSTSQLFALAGVLLASGMLLRARRSLHATP